MRVLIIAMTALIVAFQCGACASRQATIPLTKTPSNLSLARLKRSEYRLLGDATARSCATFVGLFPLPIWYVTLDRDPEKKTQKPEFWLFGASITPRARQAALYKALSRSNATDSLIFPRENVEETAAIPWYDKVCVTVRGKAIQILPDPPGPNDPPPVSPSAEPPEESEE